MYVKVLNCMRILVLPLRPLKMKGNGRESGRGLRTIISGLEHGVTIITTDTPYTRDYLLNYNCATLLPKSASAQEYWKHIGETLTLKKLCSLNAYNHSFNAETATSIVRHVVIRTTFTTLILVEFGSLFGFIKYMME